MPDDSRARAGTEVLRTEIKGGTLGLRVGRVVSPHQLAVLLSRVGSYGFSNPVVIAFAVLQRNAL
jgi:hypothetical protein